METRSPESGSGLFYSGTREEVKLGDRVRIRRWIRSDQFGTVIYIPGLSPRHKELEGRDFRKWAIELEDPYRTVVGMYYGPEESQPSKRIELVSRGEPRTLDPAVILDPTQDLEEEGSAPP
jgi:hypothetical protein